MPQGRRPFAVRRLVLAHQQERLGGVAVFHPVQRQVGDDVGGVARMGDLPAVVDHRRVVVDPLAGEDVPFVETGRITDQVPFADDRRLVAGFLQQFRESHLGRVEPAVGVVVKAVEVVVLPRQHARPAGPADGIGHQAAVEPHALPGQPVDVRRLVELARVTVGADRLIGMVIREDEHDVGFVGRRSERPQQQPAEQGAQMSHGDPAGLQTTNTRTKPALAQNRHSHETGRTRLSAGCGPNRPGRTPSPGRRWPSSCRRGTW